MPHEDPDTQTCGKGLADHAAIIDSLAAYAAGNADVLESHVPMLDESDTASADEAIVYRELVSELRRANEALCAAATRMHAARNIAMGRHLDSVEANAAMAAAFRRFVDAESTLVHALSARLAEDRAMLREME